MIESTLLTISTVAKIYLLGVILVACWVITEPSDEQLSKKDAIFAAISYGLIWPILGTIFLVLGLVDATGAFKKKFLKSRDN